MILLMMMMLAQNVTADRPRPPQEVIDLRLQLDDAKRREAQLQLKFDALQFQFDAILNRLMETLARPTIDKANAETKTLMDGIVKDLGGDPAKGDTYDRVKKALVRGGEKP